jgi:uncharacterized protein (DUF885 family)
MRLPSVAARIPSACLLFLGLAIVTGVADQPVPASGPAIAGDTPTVALADDVVATIKRYFPEFGTFLGLPDADHGRVTDNSLEGRAKLRVEEDQLWKRLLAIDEASVAGRPEGIIYGFVREALETEIGNRVCETELWNVNQINGWQVQYSQLAGIQPIDSEELQKQAIARFRGLATYVDREIGNLREGLRQGYSAPRTNVDAVIS